MHDVAVVIADDLHFDMAGPTNQFFEIHLAVAKSLLGFAAAQRHQFLEGAGIFDHAHAAPAAAP